jgi:hypothetical protein
MIGALPSSRRTETLGRREDRVKTRWKDSRTERPHMRLASEAPMGPDGDRVEPDRGGVPPSTSAISQTAWATLSLQPGLNSGLRTPSVSSMRTRAMPLGVTGPVPSSRSASPRIASRPALTAARSITTAEINRPDAARSTNSTTPRDHLRPPAAHERRATGGTKRQRSRGFARMSGGKLPVEPRARDTHPQPEGKRTIGTDRLASVIRPDLVKSGRQKRVGPDRSAAPLPGGWLRRRTHMAASSD